MATNSAPNTPEIDVDSGVDIELPDAQPLSLAPGLQQQVIRFWIVRAAEVDPVALLGVGLEVGHRPQVDHRVGVASAEDVLGGALADVVLEDPDALGGVVPGAAVDADDLVPRLP